MQLKMNKSNFNINKIKQLLQEENAFITGLFSKVDLPNQNKEDDVEMTAESQNGKNKLLKASSSKGVKATRAKSLEELQARLESLKSKKSFSYKEKLSKKALRTHIKKKLKKSERINSKAVKVPKAGENGDMNEEEKEEKCAKPPKPVFNSEGKIVFSKFDFSGASNKKHKKKIDNDPQKILEKLNKNKEKIETLKSEGEVGRAQELKEKIAWKTALAKAEGQKVKDDPDLLKKSMKKQEQIKRSSAKKWQARKEGVKKAQEERQRKRETNINKRKDEKKNKKLKKAVKRGRVIPGF